MKSRLREGTACNGAADKSVCSSTPPSTYNNTPKTCNEALEHTAELGLSSDAASSRRDRISSRSRHNLRRICFRYRLEDLRWKRSNSLGRNLVPLEEIQLCCQKSSSVVRDLAQLEAARLPSKQILHRLETFPLHRSKITSIRSVPLALSRIALRCQKSSFVVTVVIAK